MTRPADPAAEATEPEMIRAAPTVVVGVDLDGRAAAAVRWAAAEAAELGSPVRLVHGLVSPHGAHPGQSLLGTNPHQAVRSLVDTVLDEMTDVVREVAPSVTVDRCVGEDTRSRPCCANPRGRNCWWWGPTDSAGSVTPSSAVSSAACRRARTSRRDRAPPHYRCAAPTTSRHRRPTGDLGRPGSSATTVIRARRQRCATPRAVPETADGLWSWSASGGTPRSSATARPTRSPTSGTTAHRRSGRWSPTTARTASWWTRYGARRRWPSGSANTAGVTPPATPAEAWCAERGARASSWRPSTQPGP